MFRNERDKQLYEKLHVAANDIAMARQCAEFILKKGWHHEPYERRGSIYFQQSVYMTTLVVSYARAFTRSKGWPRLPVRLHGFSKSEQKLHKKLLALRNSVYAHSDSERYSIRPMCVGAYIGVIIGEPTLKITRDEATRFLTMTGTVLSAIIARRDALVVGIPLAGRGGEE